MIKSAMELGLCLTHKLEFPIAVFSTFKFKSLINN